MLEQRAASRLMRTAHKVGRPVHFDRYLLPIVEGSKRIDAVPGDLATVLFLYMDIARTDFSYHTGLQQRRPPLFRNEGVEAGLP